VSLSYQTGNRGCFKDGKAVSPLMIELPDFPTILLLLDYEPQMQIPPPDRFQRRCVPLGRAGFSNFQD
jgi:hypothetical protein